MMKLGDGTPSSFSPPTATHRRRRSKLGAVVTALAVAAGLLAAAPASAVDDCNVRRTPSTGSTLTTCVADLRLNSQKFVSIWRDSVSNSTAQPIKATCKATTSGTLTFSFDFSGDATAKAWVFANVSLRVAGGIKSSITTGIDVSSTFTAPAYGVTNCDRGIVRQNFSARVTETTRFKARPPKIAARIYSGFGPVRAQWQIKQL